MRRSERGHARRRTVKTLGKQHDRTRVIVVDGSRGHGCGRGGIGSVTGPRSVGAISLVEPGVCGGCESEEIQRQQQKRKKARTRALRECSRERTVWGALQYEEFVVNLTVGVKGGTLHSSHWYYNFNGCIL